MAVGQSSTRGLSDLPGTVDELDRIEEITRNLTFTRLEGNKATPDVVLDGMQSHSWVHFACHGSQDSSDPTKSAFHLHDDARLDLAAITRKPLQHADLAFLSACQTAAGDKSLPEEAVHLAAGMMMAGYPGVVATMWSIDDRDAPLVANKFYAYMLEDGVPDGRKAAKALHAAVGHLRAEVGRKNVGRWAPYIHMGR